jgi:hypothetical protein
MTTASTMFEADDDLLVIETANLVRFLAVTGGRSIGCPLVTSQSAHAQEGRTAHGEW